MRLGIGLLVLAIQLAWVLYTHLRPLPHASYVSSVTGGCSEHPFSCTRYFAWAPNDYSVEYVLTVETGGRTLTESQARTRFHLPQKTVFEDPPQRVIDTIRQYENTYRKGKPDRVTLRFRVNGRTSAETWRWPVG
jgi:hypothetical protein